MVRRVAAVACVMIVFLLAADASARASSEVRVTDPVGDVHLGSDPVARAKPNTLRNVDITAAVIRRTSRHLVVRITYWDLDRHAPGDWNVDFNVSTSGGSDYSYNVAWERGQWSGSGRVDGKFVHDGDWYQSVSLVKGTSEDGGDSQCPHATSAAVDYRRNTVTVRVASRCLNHNPTWMRVEDLETGREDYTDIPFNSDWRSESTPPLFSPRR